MAFPDDSQNLQNFDSAMRIRYGKAITETINRKVVLYNLLNKTKEHWTGKHHEVPVYLRSSNAVGARNEGGNLPLAASDTYLPSIIKNRFNYVVMSVTNIAEAQTADQAGAWASVKTAQLKNRVKDMTDSMNRQLNGDGTGLLCEVQSFAGSTVTIKGYDDGTVPANLAGGPATAANNVPRSTRHIKQGMRVAWGSTAAATEFEAATEISESHGTVDSVAKTAPFTTFDITKVGAGGDPAAGDVFVLGGALSGNTVGAEDTSYKKEMMGIAGAVSDQAFPNFGGTTATFQEISPSTNVEWQAQLFANPAGEGSERPLTEDLLNQAVDAVNDLSPGQTDLLVMHTATQRAFLNMMKSKGQERFQPLELAGGYKALSYYHDGAQIPMVAGKDVRHRQIFVLSKAALKIMETSPFKFDRSGGDTWKWVSGKDEVTAYGRTYSNLGVTSRNGLARIKDIAVTGLVA
jgi:hypothetical protein